MRTLPRAPFERRRPDRRWRPVARARTPQLIHRDRSAAGTSDHAARPPALDEYLWPTAPVLAMYASSAVGRIRARSTRIANCIANTLTASTDWTPAGRRMVPGLVQEYRPQEDLRRDAALVQEFSAMSCASALLRVVSSCCDTARSARTGMRARARRLYGSEPVQPRHQRVLERRMNGQRRQRGRQFVAVPPARRAGPTPAPSWSVPRRRVGLRRSC